MKIIKNNKKKQKCRYFPKMLCILVFIRYAMECGRGKQGFSNKVIVLNATSVLIFQYKKMSEKRVSKNIIQLVYFNYYKGKSAKEIADMFSLKIRTVYNIVFRAKKEGRLDLIVSKGRPKKVTQREERKITNTIYDRPQSSTRGLVEKYLELRVSHETIRNVL